MNGNIKHFIGTAGSEQLMAPPGIMPYFPKNKLLHCRSITITLIAYIERGQLTRNSCDDFVGKLSVNKSME